MEKLDVWIVNFDLLEDREWVQVKPADRHCKDGFRIARPVLDAFVDGGSATGKLSYGKVFAAFPDRVAVDAVDMAIINHLSSNEAIIKLEIIDQKPIARAAELVLVLSQKTEAADHAQGICLDGRHLPKRPHGLPHLSAAPGS